jgi:hypothetical protein
MHIENLIKLIKDYIFDNKLYLKNIILSKHLQNMILKDLF